MDDSMVARIAANPDYQKLKETRSKFGWFLTIIMLIIYYGFILLIAFKKDFLATKIGPGVMTWGIPIGFGVLIITLILTAIYVNRANGEFDRLSEKLKAEVLK